MFHENVKKKKKFGLEGKNINRSRSTSWQLLTFLRLSFLTFMPICLIEITIIKFINFQHECSLSLGPSVVEKVADSQYRYDKADATID
jgi:hypothetical protein